MAIEKGIPFRLIGIHTEQFAILVDVKTLDDNLELNTSIAFKVDKSKKIIGCIVGFDIEHEEKKLLKLEVSCHFNITDEAWTGLIAEDTFKLPKGLAQHLAMITVGTARGVFHAKTEKTAYNNFIIPTINVTKFIDTDLIFDSNEEE